MEETLFSSIKDAPPIEVLDMKKRFDEDGSNVKINLTVGGYKVKGAEYKTIAVNIYMKT